MKISVRHGVAKLLFFISVGGFAACANRGMEAPRNLFSDGGGPPAGGNHGGGASGASASGAGGHLSGSGGAATGGSGATGDSGATGGGGAIGDGGTAGGFAAGGSAGAGISTGGRGGGPGTGGAIADAGVAGRPGGAGGTSTGGDGGGLGGAAGGGGHLAVGGAGGTAGQRGTGGTNQVIVSIDFIGGRTATGGSGLVAATTMTASESAGVKPAMNWNGGGNIMGTVANLRASDGTMTTATVTWSSPPIGGNPGEWTNGFADAPGDTRMMSGYLDPTSSSSPATVKVNGLPAAITGGYDVYVYALGDIPDSSTRTYQYAIGATTVTMSQTGPSTSFPGFSLAAPGRSGDYIIFRNVSGAAFTLTAIPGTGNQSRAPINGIQVVWPSGS